MLAMRFTPPSDGRRGAAGDEAWEPRTAPMSSRRYPADAGLSLRIAMSLPLVYGSDGRSAAPKEWGSQRELAAGALALLLGPWVLAIVVVAALAAVGPLLLG